MEDYLLLILVGFIAGIINVVAGGGSLLTLPILIFLGLPPNIANGTNRIAIIIQNIFAIKGFQSKGISSYSFSIYLAIPATIGAILGSLAGVKIEGELFNKILGVKIFKEGKNLKSNYWLQTLIFDKKYKFLKNRLLNYCYKKKIYLRPTWRLISNLKPYNKKQKMDLAGARDITERTINLPSSSSILINRL